MRIVVINHLTLDTLDGVMKGPVRADEDTPTSTGVPLVTYRPT